MNNIQAPPKTSIRVYNQSLLSRTSLISNFDPDGIMDEESLNQ
jgi:hypothetical protein